MRVVSKIFLAVDPGTFLFRSPLWGNLGKLEKESKYKAKKARSFTDLLKIRILVAGFPC